MIRIGIVDFDTSHVVEFTKRLNHVDIEEDQWVEGARVVAGVPGTSLVSPERIPGFTAKMEEYGVALFDDPADLFGKIDAVLIESIDGSVHLERARPFLERGVPMFVDKPFACSTADARAIVELAERTHTPLLAGSSLRYAPEVVAAVGGTESTGPIVGVETYGPAPTHPRNPGLFHYGVHPVEILYTLMGPGCRRVVCARTEGADLATGTWADGRVASIRGIRRGKADYGFTLFGEKAVANFSVGTRFIYREQLKQIVAMFETRLPPFDPRESLELVAFIEAANRSGDSGGQPVEIEL